MSRKWNVLIGLVLIAILISFKVYNDNKEKNLNDVISYEPSSIDYLVINHDFKTDKKEHAQQLNELLSKYRVKRMKDREWDSDVSKEIGYFIAIYSNGKPFIASIYEERILLGSGKAYNVLNGPIDMSWFEKTYNNQ